MKEQIKNRLWLMLPIIASGILLDQLTKYWAVTSLKSIAQTLRPGEYIATYLWDSIRITFSHNPGAFLGMGGDWSSDVRFWVFAFIPALFLLALVVYLLVAKEMDRLHLAAFSAVFVGGFSNVIDRLHNDGLVVDFLNMGIGNLRTGIFNVADMYIMAGAFMVIIGTWLFHGKSKAI